MPEISSQTKNELNTRKEILNKHLTKFNRLKNECRWSEAWSQLLLTLNYANDTLKYSANLLKNISEKMPELSPEQKEKIAKLANHATTSTDKAKKNMIVIPKKPNIH